MLTQSTSGLLDMSEAAIGVAIRSCPGVQPRRSYSRLHAIIADSASFANSADRFANNFASDTHLERLPGSPRPRVEKGLAPQADPVIRSTAGEVPRQSH